MRAAYDGSENARIARCTRATNSVTLVTRINCELVRRDIAKRDAMIERLLALLAEAKRRAALDPFDEDLSD
jgi:hypothetical protein